jgi:uncharacterized membrane protein YfcA
VDWWTLHVLLFAIGVAVGTYGTLIGAGGGFVLVPVLLFLYPGETPEQLTAVSLAVVFANAASGSVAYLRARRVDIRTAALFAAAALPGSIAGAFASRLLTRGVFAVLLGLMLLTLSVGLLVNPSRRLSFTGLGAMERRELTDASGTTYRYQFNLPLGMVASAIVGFVSSILGIGGGIIHVPFMAQVLGFPPHIATATSHAVLAIMAGTASLTHLVQGTYSHVAFRTIFLAAGVIVGAQVGARMSERVRGAWLIRLLAIALLPVGLRLLAAPVLGV